MFKPFATALTLSALLAVPMASHAVIYTFNASLSGANEVPAIVGPGTGTAILDYNDNNTLSLADDTYNFSMSVFGLSSPATGVHIHGAASTTENAPVRVALNAAPFVSHVSGGTLLVGGNNVVAPTTLFVTVASPTNAGYGPMSFLDMLRGGLAYVNVHTAVNPGGAVRGQLIQVTAVPEVSTYAMMLAGLGAVGLMARRRRANQT